MPFQIVREDITRIKADAIVEPVKHIGAFGTLKPSEVKVTKASETFGKFVISTCGPMWNRTKAHRREILAKCYHNSIYKAIELGCESVAIPLIPNGKLWSDGAESLKAAISEIRSALNDNELKIILAVKDSEVFEHVAKEQADIDALISVLDKDMKLALDFCAEARVNARPDGVASKRLMGMAAMPVPKLHESMSKCCMSMLEDTVEMQSDALCESLDDAVLHLGTSFIDRIYELADERGMTDVEVYKAANLERKAFNKLKNGITKTPSKTTAWALAVGLKLDMDEIDDLFARAGYAVSPCSRQDQIVKYFVEHNVYDIYAINFALWQHDEQPLGTFSEG